MATEGFKRKLTAIVSADVEGYSRLMGEDEEATVRTLTACREVMTNLIRQFRGRTFLLSFPVWWMQCSVPWKSSEYSRPEMPNSQRIAEWSFASGSTSGT